MTEHPDDELLSAAIDGEAELGDHASCATCLARQAQLRGIASVLATPPAAIPDSAAAARAAVLSARAPVVDIATRRRTPPTWAIAVAAAVVAMLVAVPMLRARDDGESTADLAAEEVPALDGGDLGAIDDEFVLQNAIAPSVGAEAAVRSSGAPITLGSPGAAGAASAGTEAFAATSTTAAAADDAGSSQDAALEAPAPKAASAQTAVAGKRAAPCTLEARAIGRDRIGPLIYAARVRWKGTPAVALGFEGAGKGAGRTWVLVMARSGCRLLVTQSF